MLKKLPLIGALVLALSLSDSALAANPQVAIKTSMGEIVVELYPDKAPKSVENFLQYTRDGFYAGTVFHRVIDGFMIQGGGFTGEFYKGVQGFGQKKTRAPIAIESQNGLKNDRGWLAMARTSDPNSATAQFFINVKDNAFLDFPSRDGWGYAVFGKVTQGLDVVDRIAKVATGNRSMHQNVPLEPVTIQSVRVIPEKK